MRKMYKTVLLLIIMSILIFPVVAIDSQSIKDPVTYKILVDQNYGFFRTFEMYDKISGNQIYPENGTLDISKGDIVTFVSDTMPDRRLTIISEEKLWSDTNGTLKVGGKELSYAFNRSGTYNMYIKERPLLKQIIIVGPIDVNTTNATKSNLTNDTKPSPANITGTKNLTNVTKSNLANGSGQNNITQNPVTTKSNSTPIISVGLTGDLYSKIKSRYDTLILVMILVGMYVLSTRIKED